MIRGSAELLLTAAMLLLPVIPAAGEAGERAQPLGTRESSVEQLQREFERAQSNTRFERQITDIRAREAQHHQQLELERRLGELERRLESERQTRELMDGSLRGRRVP